MRPADPSKNGPVPPGSPPAPARRRGFAWLVSVVVHVAFVSGLLILPGRSARKDTEARPIDIVFYKPEVERPVMPPPEPEPAAEPLPEPPLEPASSIRQTPPEPVPVPRPAIARRASPPPPAPPPRTERRPTAPEPAVAQATPPPPPEPERVVATGAFAGTVSEPTTERPRERAVATVGAFGDQPAPQPPEPPPTRNRVVAAGAFGGGAVEVQREPERPEREVAVNGFGGARSANAPPARKREPREVVQASGFGAADDQEPARPAVERRSVAKGGFGDVENKRAARGERARPADELDSPVEVVSKPTPAYTAEAKALRIEGEVVLEVLFGGSGKLEVLRVIEGLGHGLDEAAVEAAKRIRFTPARRDGRPVDHTATLRVVFRLA